jgi:hypothetical protein
MASSSVRNGNRKTALGKRGPNASAGTRQRSVQGWAEHLETPRETVEGMGTDESANRAGRACVRPWGTPPRCRRWPFSWGRVCAPQGKRRMAAFCCTDLQATPAQILEWVVRRWLVQAIVEEARTHLGVETQCQWADQGIARTAHIARYLPTSNAKL